MSSTASVAGDPRPSVIVLQTSNADVMDLAQCLNDSTRTAFEKWMHMAYLQTDQRSVVETLRANHLRNPDELACAIQVLNAITFIRRHHERYGPEVFPNIQVVDIFND